MEKGREGGREGRRGGREGRRGGGGEGGREEGREGGRGGGGEGGREGVQDTEALTLWLSIVDLQHHIIDATTSSNHLAHVRGQLEARGIQGPGIDDLRRLVLATYGTTLAGPV